MYVCMYDYSQFLKYCVI